MSDEIDYPYECSDEPYYFLCETCENNDGTNCRKSGFPIKMCYRKRKCKDYDKWEYKREDQLREFVNINEE